MIGETILHYKILEKLGEGGMGVVYLAEDLNLERKVAIKFLPKHIAVNPENKERFKIEAKAAAALNHPNIATIHAIEETDDELFFVMEYIEGKELKDIIKTQRDVSLSSNKVIQYALQIAEGLKAAHEKGIVHRDIKSQNIMITNDDKVKIMDFGLAKVKGEKQLTKIGTTIGTPAYMSPEQARGDEIDYRTDIWSFGIVLYEMLTGRLPFKGDYDQAIIYSILNEQPEDISSGNISLKNIIAKLLAKEPEDRYQSMDEIINELNLISEKQSDQIKKSKKNQFKLIIPAAAIIIIIISIAVYYFVPFSEHIDNSIKTIAVLPFDDMSPKKDQEYFSDGLTEELLNVLAKNPKLRVTSRTSAFSFKGANTDIKTIAGKLNVRHILEGSVRKSGNRVRITAELIDAETDAYLWSQSYEGELKNIFLLQDSISASVAKALNTKLLGNKFKTSDNKINPEAYNYYLQAEHLKDQFNKESWEKAIKYYNKTLEMDSSYAPAWTGLSYVHMNMASNGYLTISEGMSKAYLEVEKALSYDPYFAKAYDAKAVLLKNYYWNWDAASKNNQRALELEPGNSDLLIGAAQTAAILGNFNKALKLLRHSIELDPVNPMAYFFLGFDSYRAELVDDALSAFKKTIELNPQFKAVHTYIGLVYLAKGKPDSALSEILKVGELFWRDYGLALTYFDLGDTTKADEVLNKLIKKNQTDAACQIAEIYAYRNKPDKSFLWLERAYKQRDPGLADIKGDPLMHNIKNDPRYAEFLNKMKLPL